MIAAGLETEDRVPLDTKVVDLARGGFHAGLVRLAREANYYTYLDLIELQALAMVVVLGVPKGEAFTIADRELGGDGLDDEALRSLYHRLAHVEVKPARMSEADAVLLFLEHAVDLLKDYGPYLRGVAS